MPRPRTSFALLTATFALAALAARAQTAAAPAAAPDDTANSPVFTPQAAAPVIKAPVMDDDHGDPRRIQSSELSSALMSSMPKYSPPKPEPPKPEVSPADQPQPKNGVVRLPKYVVHDQAPPIFTKKDVMTDEERKQLAMKQYIIDTKDMPTLAAYMSDMLFQDNASQQYADAERASNISSLRSDASAAAVSGDRAESDFIRAQSNDTYLRRSDWAPIGSRTTTSSSAGEAGGGNGQ
jgi:hypothetical protein